MPVGVVLEHSGVADDDEESHCPRDCHVEALGAVKEADQAVVAVRIRQAALHSPCAALDREPSGTGIRVSDTVASRARELQRLEPGEVCVTLSVCNRAGRTRESPSKARRWDTPRRTGRWR